MNDWILGGDLHIPCWKLMPGMDEDFVGFWEVFGGEIWKGAEKPHQDLCVVFLKNMVSQRRGKNEASF